MILNVDCLHVRFGKGIKLNNIKSVLRGDI